MEERWREACTFVFFLWDYRHGVGVDELADHGVCTAFVLLPPFLFTVTG
jgi:hypothetical protein